MDNTSDKLNVLQLFIWRHPRPKQVAGRCIGQYDVEVHRRKSKRLANQINHFVKKNKLPKVIWVSNLQRSKSVGIFLQKYGFKCYIDPQLSEIDFGEWEGRLWKDIPKVQIDEWCTDFADFAPLNGESLTQLFERVGAWLGAWLNDRVNTQQLAQADSKHAKEIPSTISSTKSNTVLVIGHAGWITSAKFTQSIKNAPTSAKDWPASVNYGELTQLNFNLHHKMSHLLSKSRVIA